MISTPVDRNNITPIKNALISHKKYLSKLTVLK